VAFDAFGASDASDASGAASSAPDRAEGAEGSFLQASLVGRKLCTALGDRVVEHWQLWSRPGWVTGRA
jgi:hypothetical protein